MTLLGFSIYLSFDIPVFLVISTLTLLLPFQLLPLDIEGLFSLSSPDLPT